jgi:hypothetical protein
MIDKEEINPIDEHRRWTQELKLAAEEDKKWLKRGDKIVKRYRDERQGWSDTGKRYNILWANIQTMLPALYGRTPRAQVERRWKDKDPVGRTAAVILERALQYEIDHYGDFDNTNKHAVLDRLLPGRGTAWVRFETKEVAEAEVIEEPTEDVMGEQPDMTYECTPTDYVFWKDFRCSPARTWDEVTWVARRIYMTRADGVKRFGDDFKEVPLAHEPIGLDDLSKAGASQAEQESLKKAIVWEIWSKGDKRVYWVAEGHNKLLDSKEDPYGLDNFWPCPKPLFATQTTDTLVPVPDYALYQDQAEEIDMLTQRIGNLAEALKVVGVYDASQPAIARMLNEGVNNTLIGVDSWAAFGEKGGLKGTIDFLPLDQVVNALNHCYTAREQAKQVVYEVTGLSDIIRGASMASETATAQQIKSQYASLRLKRMQTEVAQFCSDLLRIKAQMMCDLYSPESLIEMSGIMGTDDAQYAEKAIALIKQEPSRSFRIEVAADSLVEMDEIGEKQSRTEFMTAFGTVLRDAVPMVQAAPEMGALVGEVLQFVVRTFKGGRQLENVLETTIAKMNEPKPPAPPQPDPEQMKAEAMMQVEQGKMQLEQAKIQTQGQIEQFKAEQAKELEQMRQEYELAREQVRQEAETQRLQMKAQIEADTKLQIAEMQSSLSEKQAVSVEIAGEEKLSKIGEQVKQMADMQQSAVLQAVEMLAESVGKMNKPRRKLLQRGEDGRAIGVIEIEED